MTKTLTLRAVDYLRVSTEEQAKGYGVQAASKKTTKHIGRKGWEHIGTFADEGLSGSLEAHDRPDLKRLMEEARSTPRPFDMVVVSEGRAIGRTGRAFWRWVWELEELGVYVAVVKGDYDNSTQDGRKKMRKDADYAEEEREIIRERTQGGIQEKAEEGGHFGGNAPYGWRIEDKGKLKLSRLVIDEDAAKVLREAYRLMAGERMNMREAAQELILQNHPAPRGGKWSANSLRKILKGAPVQEGVRIYRSSRSSTGTRGTKLDADGRPVYGETVTVELDRIFTEEEVTKLNAAMERTARKPFKKGGAAHPLSKRLYGACGKHYTGVNRTDRYGRSYRCSGKIEAYAGQPRCGCSQVDAQGLEARVWGEVCKLLQDPERLQAMAGDWADLAARSGVNYEDRIAELEQQISGQDAAITAAVVAAAKEPDAAAAIGAAVAQLKDERARLNDLLEEAKAWHTESLAAGQRARDLQALAEMARERLHDMQPQEQAEVLALLDVKVTILGEVPVRVREDDRVSGWFRSRKRIVPDLTDTAWALVAPVLTAKRPGRPTLDPRTALDAMLHKARTGCTWRDLPEHYGRFGTVASAFNRWQRSGLWEQSLDLLAGLPGTPLPEVIVLPPLRVEGRLDPRLLIGEQVAPGEMRSWQHDP
ncbi:recombinase family protein [Streptomyces sp. NPDC019443]|uniref:recombinase family protein n=1 Tax=Streptomyces sp. NPDC019443 TaxID=3365061 RepID=UPI0037A264BC